MLIFLIGMPGTGKSSIGKNVSKMLNLNFIDLDKVIEKKHNKSITNIWKEFGEDYFRKIESESLKEISISSATIVSCGGGTPCFFDNLEWMNNHGHTFFLELPLDVLAKRNFEKKEGRPMFSKIDTLDKTEEKLKEILENRKKIYLSAKHILKLKGTFPNDFYLLKEKILELKLF
jgi:shikimate kinase